MPCQTLRGSLRIINDDNSTTITMYIAITPHVTAAVFEACGQQLPVHPLGTRISFHPKWA